MSLSSGVRVGPFEVLAKLGEGGMGEVYRARDTQLQRDVALKVLPESFSGDAERMARFRREATTLASLNHPHIAQIHGFEQSGNTSALVMELVEGEDLSARIARGPLPLDEALPVARQIAEGLEAAHAQGIIHRDLKPGNVKVTADGTVKVLDFGLAKALDQDPRTPGPQDLSRSPTITTPAMTMRGVILGTAAYMSPEQAKGKTVDRRADIWAFGCVLFEMITGRRAFQGEDVSDTLAAVLRGDPDWSLIPATVPPSVTALIKRCLERDLKRRVADISTARFVIDEVRQWSEWAAPVPAPVVRSRQSPLQIAGIALALTLAAAAAGWVGVRYAGQPSASAIVKFTVDPGGLALLRNPLAMSPDGGALAFSNGSQVYVRRFDAFETRRVTPGDSGVTIPSVAFSPDSKWIAYYSNTERVIKKIEVAGGTPVRVCEAPLGQRGFTWSAFGIVTTVAEGIIRCDPSGGDPEMLLQASESRELGGASILPDGAHLLFARADVANGAALWDRADIVIRSLTSGEERTIFTGGSDPRLLGEHILFMSGGIEFAFRVDPATYQRQSEPVPVIEGVRRTQGVAHMAISNTGAVAFLRGPASVTPATALGISDRAGVVTRLPIANGPYSHVRASRDGKRLAIGTDDGVRGIVWTYELGGSSPLQRLTLQGSNRFPIWSPDGAFIALQSDRDGKPGIYRQRSDGTGEVERLTESQTAEAHIPQSWSADGRHLLYALVKVKANQYTLWVLDLTSRQAAPFQSGQVASTEPLEAVLSPDGRWVAYGRTANDDLATTDRGVFVRPFPSGGALFQAPRQTIDFHPVWSPGGRELIFVASASSGQMAAFPITTAAGLSFGTAVRFPAAVTGDRLSGQQRAWDILPDGRFVGPASDERVAIRSSEINVIVNWLEEIKARVAQR